MKKRILWIVNIMLPEIAQKLGMDYSPREGWLSGVFAKMTADNPDYELGVAFPTSDGAMCESDSGCRIIDVRGIKCYPFFEDLLHPEIYDSGLEDRLDRIMSDFNPDLVHIFGTEFPHGLAAATVFGESKKTLVGLQGLCGRIARDYMADIPLRVQRQVTLRDFLKKDSLADQKKKFLLRGENERKLIEKAGYVTGRTSFDKEETMRINSDCIYLPMNETMRAGFYDGEWDYASVDKHTLFTGQGDYPIKGFHFLIEAMGMLVKKYPDICLRIAGNSIIETKTLKDRLKAPAYGKYLRKLIKKNNLSGHIEVLGMLPEEEMKENYLKSSVYVLPSYIENSPNTLAEAMLLGMPVVASMAGGIPDMISKEEGWTVPRGDARAIFEAVDEIWTKMETEPSYIFDKCQKARVRAHKAHDSETNYMRLMEIYAGIDSDKEDRK